MHIMARLWKPIKLKFIALPFCRAQQYLVLLMNRLVAVPLPTYFQRTTTRTRHGQSHPSQYVRAIPHLIFINFHSSLLLSGNGTDFPLMLCSCLHWISSVWQSGLLTTKCHKHNRPAFNLIYFEQLTISSVFRTSLSYLFNLTIHLPSFSRRAIILHVILARGCCSTTR